MFDCFCPESLSGSDVDCEGLGLRIGFRVQGGALPALCECVQRNWVFAKEFVSNYHRKETILFAIDPEYYGNLN